MSKERDWVDYANLASNLAQNAQLSGIKDRLSILQETAALQAREAELTRLAALKAEQKIERMAHYREAVVQGEQALAGLRHHLLGNPLAVMTLALAYGHSYKEHGLRTECFQSFEDKDRVVRLFTGLDEVGEAAAEKLTPEQRHNAKLCLQYRLEESDLKHLVEVQKHREQEGADRAERARELEPEIQELKKQVEALAPRVREAELAAQSPANIFRLRALRAVFGFFGVLAALGLTAFVGTMLYIICADPNPSGLMMCTAVIQWTALLTCISASVAWWANSAWKKARKVPGQDQLRALQAKLEADDASASTRPLPPSDEERALYARFGGGPETSSSEYERMLAERQALIASVLCDRSAEGRSASGPPPPRTLPGQAPPLPGETEPEGAVTKSPCIRCPIGTAFCFEPGDDLPGDFGSLDEAVENPMYGPLGNRDQALDRRIQNGYSFVVVETPTMLRVYSKTPKIEIPGPHIELFAYLSQGFGIDEDMKAVWQAQAKGPSKLVRLATLFVSVDPPSS